MSKQDTRSYIYAHQENENWSLILNTSDPDTDCQVEKIGEKIIDIYRVVCN